METSSNPATRLVLALVALHATSGADLRNLVLSDVLLTRRQLLIRRPHGRHVAHLVRAFGISITTAMKYIHAAHPHRAGPVPH
ncbi:hypothetical protein [Streptomyces sp. NPDC050988]|uniref:hypothetical protein n=1 Tax=Streptomyces sp. NPDC050988 TaxID=3365637 RepID=UPI0037909B0C